MSDFILFSYRFGLIEDNELKIGDPMEGLERRNSGKLQPPDKDSEGDDKFYDCDFISDSDEDEFFDCELFDGLDLEIEATVPLPYKVGPPPDEVCLLLNELVQNGSVDTKSFFYKNLKAVAEHIVNPKAEWDFEVCEALQSIQHAGGALAVNYVVGPLGRHGPRGLPLLNYGGPSMRTIQRRKPGTMPVSGITKHLLLSTLQLLELSDVKTVSSSCLLFAVSLQIDGTMVKAGIA